MCARVACAYSRASPVRIRAHARSRFRLAALSSGTHTHVICLALQVLVAPHFITLTLPVCTMRMCCAQTTRPGRDMGDPDEPWMQGYPDFLARIESGALRECETFGNARRIADLASSYLTPIEGETHHVLDLRDPSMLTLASKITTSIDSVWDVIGEACEYSDTTPITDETARKTLRFLQYIVTQLSDGPSE